MNMPSFIQRLKAKTPPFFRKLQAFGILLSGIGEILSKYPNLPHAKLHLADMLLCAGGVIVVVSQFAVDTPTEKHKP